MTKLRSSWGSHTPIAGASTGSVGASASGLGGGKPLATLTFAGTRGKQLSPPSVSALTLTAAYGGTLLP